MIGDPASLNSNDPCLRSYPSALTLAQGEVTYTGVALTSLAEGRSLPTEGRLTPA